MNNEDMSGAGPNAPTSSSTEATPPTSAPPTTVAATISTPASLPHLSTSTVQQLAAAVADLIQSRCTSNPLTSPATGTDPTTAVPSHPPPSLPSTSSTSGKTAICVCVFIACISRMGGWAPKIPSINTNSRDAPLVSASCVESLVGVVLEMVDVLSRLHLHN